MISKRTIYLLTVMSLLASCGTELPDNIKSMTVSEGDQSVASSVLQLNKNNLSFAASEGNDSFTITSNTSWSITSDQSWCTVSSSLGSGNATITVNVQENTSLDSRIAMITVKVGDLAQTIAVTQTSANAFLQIDKSNMMFDASGGKLSFWITSNASWTVTSNQSWCSINSSSSGSGNGGVAVYVSENTSTNSRSAIITVKAADIVHTISVTQAGAVYQNTRTFTVNGVSFKMKLVEGGTFTMGATSEQGKDVQDDEKPTHRVTLSTYYIGETEVTQELWQAVMSSNPSFFHGSRKPVEQVHWNDCQDFITRLNSLTGQKFRLPTEAEWEFAARGGNYSRGYKYAGSNTINDVALYFSGSGSGWGTKQVATKSPNELGLYDMSGNVFEICQDWYGYYSSSSQTDPTGPTSGDRHVFRGGSWDDTADYCRVSRRLSSTSGSYTFGLRLAL